MPSKKASASSKTTTKGGVKKAPVAKKSASKKPAAKASTPKKAAAKKPAAKKAPARKPAAKKPVAKKAPARKPAAKKPVAKKAPARKPAAKTPVAKKAPARKPAPKKPAAKEVPQSVNGSPKVAEVVVKMPKLTKVRAAFLKKQRSKLLDLRDSLVDSMAGTARDTLRTRAEGSEASAFGMHQADAGSDSYDRDFALNLISQEQDALYEIEEALKRIESNTYGVCEMSGDEIPPKRLEALPFARFTVECQERIERENGLANGFRRPVKSLFGLNDLSASGDPVAADLVEQEK